MPDASAGVSKAVKAEIISGRARAGVQFSRGAQRGHGSGSVRIFVDPYLPDRARIVRRQAGVALNRTNRVRLSAES